MAEGRRPRRHCASRRVGAPSAVHYVGYVEDDETPEMIMKKFEELEKVRKAAPAPNQPPDRSADAHETSEAEEEPVDASKDNEEEILAGLSDEQLLEVFKQTSIFNVKSALAGNDSLLAEADLDAGFEGWSDIEDLDEEDDSRGFWSDEDDNKYSERRKKASQSKGTKKEGGVRTVSRSKPRHDVITSYNTTTRALIRKKVRVVDKDALVQIKIPYPLPLSWGRTVQPYVPTAVNESEAERDASIHANEAQPCNRAPQQSSVLSTEWSAIRNDFLGVLINPGWEVVKARGLEAAASLAKLPIPKLCPIGFIFIWVQKGHISAVMQQMGKWGFAYVENLTWVFLHQNHSVLRLPAEYVQSSHLTLFLFRKEGLGKDIELRHQRKPDVIFDTLRRSLGQAFEVPEEAYVTIETMLPSGKDHFLELWAKQGSSRPGWTQIAEKIPNTAHAEFWSKASHQ